MTKDFDLTTNCGKLPKELKESGFEKQLKEQFAEATGKHFEDLLKDAELKGYEKAKEDVKKAIRLLKKKSNKQGFVKYILIKDLDELVGV